MKDKLTLSINTPDSIKKEYPDLIGDQFVIISVDDAEQEDKGINIRVAGNGKMETSLENFTTYLRAYLNMVIHLTDDPAAAFVVAADALASTLDDATESPDEEIAVRSSNILTDFLKGANPIMEQLVREQREREAGEKR